MKNHAELIAEMTIGRLLMYRRALLYLDEHDTKNSDSYKKTMDEVDAAIQKKREEKKRSLY